MKFCKRCLLPETYPKLKINEDGLCNACEQYDEKWKHFDPNKAKSEFEKRIREITKRGEKVVVTCSGGIDSSYVAFLCKRKYNLDVIGANFNHGFVTDTAKNNLARIRETLNIPIIEITPDLEIMYRLYRDFLLATGDFCTPCCQGCCRSGFIVARNNNARTIIHGGVSGSRVEFNVLGMLRHHYDRFMKYAKNNYPTDKLQKIVTPTSEISEFNLIALPQYFDWDEDNIIGILQKEIGWETMPNGRTRHVDCLVAEVSDFLLQKKFGFSKRWMTISANIRAGLIDTETGRIKIKEEEEKIQQEPVDAMNILLEKLKLTREELYSLPFYKCEPAVRYL